MEKHPLISVVVPVYNVEKYLDRCIESIVNQSYENLEIILVEDASPDSCSEICDSWASQDSRIIVVHSTQNNGAGKARNKGLSIAKGEWIVLVDGDDYIHRDMILHLFGLLQEDVDLVECSIVNTTSDQADFTFEESVKYVVCNTYEALKNHIADMIFRQTPPNKLYRAEIIKDIPFPEGKLIDDEFWTYKVIGRCRKLIHSPNRLYAYRQQNGSVMHKKYSVKRLQALDAKLHRLEYIKNNFSELYPQAKINYLESCIFQGQMIQMHLAGKEKIEAEIQVKDYFHQVKIDKHDVKRLRITHKIWIILSQLSFTFTCKLKNSFKIGL